MATIDVADIPRSSWMGNWDGSWDGSWMGTVPAGRTNGILTTRQSCPICCSTGGGECRCTNCADVGFWSKVDVTIPVPIASPEYVDGVSYGIWGATWFYTYFHGGPRTFTLTPEYNYELGDGTNPFCCYGRREILRTRSVTDVYFGTYDVHEIIRLKFCPNIYVGGSPGGYYSLLTVETSEYFDYFNDWIVPPIREGLDLLLNTYYWIFPQATHLQNFVLSSLVSCLSFTELTPWLGGPLDYYNNPLQVNWVTNEGFEIPPTPDPAWAQWDYTKTITPVPSSGAVWTSCGLDSDGNPVTDPGGEGFMMANPTMNMSGAKILVPPKKKLSVLRPTRCEYLGIPLERKAGCTGWTTKHACQAGERFAIPAVNCQTCKKYSPDPDYQEIGVKGWMTG